ncbi:MAG: hypothetical protein LBP98_10055 [Tannerella sp.]|jgi:hypothetical protein|nr:hypothetical protein [Tannerella sp.]
MTAENSKGVNKILNDFVAQGYLRKLSKGRFYKPETSRFGELLPDTYQSVKDLLTNATKMEDKIEIACFETCVQIVYPYQSKRTHNLL